MKRTSRPLSCRAALALTLLVGALASPAARAVTYSGDPVMTLTVDRPEQDLVEGEVVLDTVRVHTCGGGWASWRPEETIDPVAGWSMDFPTGNLCEVELVWGTTMVLDGQGYVIEYAEVTTTVDLVGATQTEDLTPFDLVSGVIHGGNPFVMLTIQ